VLHRADFVGVDGAARTEDGDDDGEAIAASAAAPAMMKEGRDVPCMPASPPNWRAKARKVRLAALSISSMHMKTPAALRRHQHPNMAEAEEDGGENQVVRVGTMAGF